METINKAGLALVAAPGRLDYPRHTLTLIVKGSFDMRPGEPLHLKGPDDQSPPGDAQLVTDDDGVLWTTPSDLAYAKVQGEILVRSSCYDVGQTPRTVTLEVADKIRKALSVVGRRTAVVQAGTEPQVSLPEPARRVPIRYELAYGGPDYPYNPVGRGHLAESPSTAWALDLPCIEAFPTAPENGSDADDRSVAGFGPIAGGWEPRVSKIGTRDAKWQADRAPCCRRISTGRSSTRPRPTSSSGKRSSRATRPSGSPTSIRR